jgi:hypothetical protein
MRGKTPTRRCREGSVLDDVDVLLVLRTSMSTSWTWTTEGRSTFKTPPLCALASHGPAAESSSTRSEHPRSDCVAVMQARRSRGHLGRTSASRATRRRRWRGASDAPRREGGASLAPAAGRGPFSGRLGSITRPRVIDVDARHSERKVVVLLLADACCSCRKPRTQSDSPGELYRPLSNLPAVAKREPVTPLTGTPVNAHEGVQASRVDELKSGQIDDQMHHADRLRVKLTIKQRDRCLVKLTAQPHDQHPVLPFPANRELSGDNRLTCAGNRVVRARRVPTIRLRRARLKWRSRRKRHRTAGSVRRRSTPVYRYALVSMVHGSSLGSINKTVTEGRSDSRQRHRGHG